jgi:hypothetical protein
VSRQVRTLGSWFSGGAHSPAPVTAAGWVAGPAFWSGGTAPSSPVSTAPRAPGSGAPPPKPSPPTCNHATHAQHVSATRLPPRIARSRWLATYHWLLLLLSGVHPPCTRGRQWGIDRVPNGQVPRRRLGLAPRGQRGEVVEGLHTFQRGPWPRGVKKLDPFEGRRLLPRGDQGLDPWHREGRRRRE